LQEKKRAHCFRNELFASGWPALPALPAAEQAGVTGSAAAAFAQTTVKRKSYSRQSGRINPQQKKASGSRLKLLAAGEGFEFESLHLPELF